MASRSLSLVTLFLIACTLHAQPRHIHTIKAIPSALLNPLYQTVQIGYECHYNQRNAIHVEAGYFHNELIFSELHGIRHIQGLKLRAERRFYTGGGRVRDLWNHHAYLAPHVLFQRGWLNYEEEFPRHGGTYFERMQVNGNFTQFGLGATYGSYFDVFGTFVVEGSVQVGIRTYRLTSDMPDDIFPDFFPSPWRTKTLNTWYGRPMVNLTLALGLGWGNLRAAEN